MSINNQVIKYRTFYLITLCTHLSFKISLWPTNILKSIFFYVFYLISIYKPRQTCNNNNSKFTRKNQRQKSTKKYLLTKTKSLNHNREKHSPQLQSNILSFYHSLSSSSQAQYQNLIWHEVCFEFLPYNVKKTCITENKTYPFQKSNFLSYQEDLYSLNHWRNW